MVADVDGINYESFNQYTWEGLHQSEKVKNGEIKVPATKDEYEAMNK